MGRQGSLGKEREGCRPRGRENKVGRKKRTREGTRTQRKKKGKKKETWARRRHSGERRSDTEMKLQGSLACLLLALCLGRGEAGPLLNAGASAQGVGEAIGRGVGDAISHGIGEAFSPGAGEAAPSGIQDAMGPAVGDTFGHRVGEAIHQGVGEAAHALGNTGSEAGRQAENIIRHGLDGAHNSWQGIPGSNSAWVSGWKETGCGNGRLWAAGLRILGIV